MSDDTHFMRLALALGRRGLGTTWPNPSVGAVVVEPGTGRILGTAATARGDARTGSLWRWPPRGTPPAARPST